MDAADDEDDSGGGGNDRVSDKPKTSPSGGIPLPFAVQSDKRLRSGHDKLADPGRRDACARARPLEPARPTRRRVTSPVAQPANCDVVLEPALHVGPTPAS